MNRPGDKILQFARSSSGKQRVSSTVEGHGGRKGRQAAPQGGRSVSRPTSEYQTSSADSLWSSSHINAHKRPNGTFINGPEAMDSGASKVVLAVLVLTLLGLGAWLYKSFLEAETAIIHAMGGK